MIAQSALHLSDWRIAQQGRLLAPKEIAVGMGEAEDSRSLDLSLHGGGVYRYPADVTRTAGAQAHGADAARREQLAVRQSYAKPFS